MVDNHNLCYSLINRLCVSLFEALSMEFDFLLKKIRKPINGDKIPMEKRYLIMVLMGKIKERELN
jgi:hypothetical protein